MLTIRWHPTDRELRQFAGLWFPAFWLLVVLIGRLWRLAPAAVTIIAAVVVLVAVMGLVRPHSVRPVYVAWMCAAYPIGWLVSHLLLAGVFYLLITPLACVLRWTGRDKLGLRFDPGGATYWQRRPPAPPRERYFRQF